MITTKRVCEDPNGSFISEARKEPRAPAASSGSVIMHRDLKSLFYNNHGSVVIGQFAGLGATTAIPAMARVRQSRLGRSQSDKGEGETVRVECALDSGQFQAAFLTGCWAC